MNLTQLKRNKWIAIRMFLLLLSWGASSCGSESEQNHILQSDKTHEKKTGYRPIFWEIVCQTGDFPFMFDCNEDSTLYQIELLNDPFKD